VASPLVRAQLRTSPIVTTLRHQTLRIEDEPSRRLLSLLDGSHDREVLREQMQEFFRASRGPDFVLAAPELDLVLSRLAQQALLIA